VLPCQRLCSGVTIITASSMQGMRRSFYSTRLPATTASTAPSGYRSFQNQHAPFNRCRRDCEKRVSSNTSQKRGCCQILGVLGVFVFFITISKATNCPGEPLGVSLAGTRIRAGAIGSAHITASSFTATASLWGSL
jgi:hypothetical protein